MSCRGQNAERLVENKRKTPLTCMESRSFFNINRQPCRSNVAGSAAVTHAYTRARGHTHAAGWLCICTSLKFLSHLLSSHYGESNMKWFNSVIKTGNEIRLCDFDTHQIN